MSRHTKQYHNINPRKIFKCTYCNHSTFTKSCLKSHTNSKHTKENRFTCEICGFVTFQKCELGGHWKRAHSSSKPFKCKKTCGYETNDKQTLRQHILRLHNDKKPFSCDFCQYSAKIKMDESVHKRRMHDNIKKFQCSICSFSTKYKALIKSHEKIKHKSLLELAEISNTKEKRTLVQSVDKEGPNEVSAISGFNKFEHYVSTKGLSSIDLVKKMATKKLMVKLIKLNSHDLISKIH